MRWRTVVAVFLISAAPLRAQLPAPNTAGVSAGHMHMTVADPDVHKKIWVGVLGAQVVNSRALELFKLPGIFLVLRKAEPAGSSEGSTVDHFAFRAKDRPAIKAKLTAAGIPLVRDDPAEISDRPAFGRAAPHRASCSRPATGPDRPCGGTRPGCSPGILGRPDRPTHGRRDPRSAPAIATACAPHRARSAVA